MRRIIGLVLVVTLTIFATLVENYRNNLWVSYRDYRSPYVADIPSGLARTPLSARVVTILIRGLRLSTSQQMPTLNALREKGASFIIQNEPPTFRLPVWTTLISGASTEIHGVTTNQAGRLSNSSSIFREVQLSGGSVAVIGSQSLGDTLGAEVQRFEVVENPDITQRDDDAVRIGLDVLRDSQNPAALICIELTAIEDSLDAHLSDSDAAISATDARIRTIQEKLDLATTTLIIMSDRGLTLPGSDGGGEPVTAITPFIMSGAGIAVHSQGLLQSIDIAPTLAALMGVPIPAHSQGEPALAGLVVPVTQPQSQITLSSAPSSTLVVTSTMAPLTALLSGSALQLTTFYEGWSEAIHQPRFASEIFRAQQSAITNGDSTKSSARLPSCATARIRFSPTPPNWKKPSSRGSSSAENLAPVAPATRE